MIFAEDFLASLPPTLKDLSVSLCSTCIWIWICSELFLGFPLTSCRTHCTAVRVVERSPPPPTPPDKSSPRSRPGCSQSHTLQSILSLQTGARSPLSGPHSLSVWARARASPHPTHLYCTHTQRSSCQLVQR